MSRPECVPLSNPSYYSAHRGPVYGSDGKFDHFARRCDPIHTMNGYWKFCTYGDDRRAFELDLFSPEAVLIAQDLGTGRYDGIMLRWVPGELDLDNKSSVGTAAAHLRAIYDERRVLGKQQQFRGRVPLYPIGSDQRLIDYRLMRYGLRKCILPETVLVLPCRQAPSCNTVFQHSTLIQSAMVSHSRGPVSMSESVSAEVQEDGALHSVMQTDHKQHPISPHRNLHTVRSSFLSASPHISSLLARTAPISSKSSFGSQQQSQSVPRSISPQPRPQSPVILPAQSSMNFSTVFQPQFMPYFPRPPTSSTKLPILSSPQANTRSVSPLQAALMPRSTPRNTTPTQSRASISNSAPIRPSLVDSSLLTQRHFIKASPLISRPQASTRSDSTYVFKGASCSFLLPVAKKDTCKEHTLIYVGEEACTMYYSDGFADKPVGLTSLPVCADLTSLQRFNLQSLVLPCMDCGLTEVHASHCWIAEANLSLKSVEELTTLDYLKLAADVERFDPGPWTTHVGPPKEAVPDDPVTQVQGMAEIIRSLDESGEDPELRTLDDQYTVLLWALKLSGSIQVMKRPHSGSKPKLENLGA